MVPITDGGELDMDAFAKLLTAKTKLVGVVHVSNALGTINPVAEIIRAAHEVGAVVLLVCAMVPPDRERRGTLLAIVLALAMLFTSSFLLWAGRSCLLDTGMAFFATFTLAALLMTERHWAWWLAAGLAAGLGSLQKSHFTAGVFVLFGVAMLVAAYRRRSGPNSLRSGQTARGPSDSSRFPVWKGSR